ncbi:hypothetical protein MU516_03335 [Paracoccus sp. YLB-12]|uniref:DUF2846 domain-containing protein n=1 Tax=Paracoccus maritimus TaxID=2933292 RepID=A0ABT2K5T0_9RHOB|nr:hypothetical protein [Paracoccus sp. YLB-12]MCT4331900.1 hypothetical protein [Paracoccus sp. YLB-12]
MSCRLLALILCLILPASVASASDRPRAGLMWNQSGLPATFPLHIRTPPGRDYVVFLVEPDQDRRVMAGYIHGGDLFRILVPPGEYDLRFAHGTEWHNQETLFGAETEWTETTSPLEFRIIGIGRRSGYLVTLIQTDGTVKLAEARPQDQCQIATFDSSVMELEEAARIARLLGGPDAPDHPPLRYLEQELELRSRVCD